MLEQDKRMSAGDVSLLTRERELLMQKLNEFEKTNRVVRKLLRENKNKEVTMGFENIKLK